MSTVRYDLEAPPDEFVADLVKAAQAMQRTADEADDLSNSMELLSIPARKVGAASKEAASGATTAKNAFDGMAQAGAAMGGKLAGASGLLKGMVDGALKAGSAFGAFGATATAVAAGVAALTYGFYSAISGLIAFGRQAVAARGDIDGFVDDEVIDNLDELDRKFQDLDLQMQILKGTIGSELTPVIGGLVDRLVGLAAVAEDVVNVLGKIQPPDSMAWRAFIGIATGGTSELGRQLEQIGEQVEEDLDGSLAQVLGSWERLKPVVADHAKGVAAVAKLYDEMDKEAEQAEKAAIAEITRRMQLGEQVTAAMDAARAKERAAEVKAGEERFRIWKSTLERELAEAEKMMSALEAQYAKDTAAFEAELEKRKALTESVFGGMISIAGQLSTQTFGAMFQELDETTRDAVNRIEEMIAASNEKIAKWRESDTEDSKRLIDDELAHIKDMEDEKKRIQLEAWKQEQGLKIGQAVMAGALAIVQAYAQLGPIAATIIAPAIVGMTAMQVETISGQSPPSFHDGGLQPDEQMFGSSKVRQGESAVFFSQKATETGAAARAVEMNRDVDMGPRESKLVLTDGGRVIGELVSREQRRRGSPIAAFGRAGFVDPYGGR